MPRFRRAARNEEIENGKFHFLNTGVEYADNGIKGLLKLVQIAQSEWLHDGTANHALSYLYDGATSRIMSRITSSAAGSITSKMRKRILLPMDFGSWPLNPCVVIARGSLPAAMTLSMLKNGVYDGSFVNVSVLPTLPSTYELKTIPSIAGGVASDPITLEFSVTTNGSGQWGEIGDLVLFYRTGKGNV